MSDENKEFNHDEFSIGNIGDEHYPQALMINIPIEKYAKEGTEGLDMAYGKIRRIEAIVVMLIKERFKKEKQTNGLVKPPLGPLTVA